MSNICRVLIFFLVGMFFSIVISFSIAGIKLNLSISMPIGLYRRQMKSVAIRNADFVSFCLPISIALIGKLRDYIGSGICPGNTMPLLKRVIALPTDKVILNSNSIIVNGKHYLAPRLKSDHENRKVIQWVKHGAYYSTNKIWVYGSNEPIHSWDSRYYGGIPLSLIQGIYRPLWVISSKNKKLI